MVANDRRRPEYLLASANYNRSGQLSNNLRLINIFQDYCENYCECRLAIILNFFDEQFDKKK